MGHIKTKEVKLLNLLAILWRMDTSLTTFTRTDIMLGRIQYAILNSNLTEVKIPE